MADNITLNAGSGGATLATDEDGVSAHHQYVKIEFGADGTQTPVSAANPLPITGPLTDTELRATPVPVSGTVTASGPLTDTELRATPVPVSGTVTASGPLTDTELRATPVPVSGTVTATGGLTDTELRASAVPVSATALPLPTGASTAANQSTEITHLSEIEGAVETIEGTVATDGIAKKTVSIQVAGEDGTNAQTLKTDADGHLQIDVLTAPTTTVTGTITETNSAAILADTAAMDTNIATIAGDTTSIDGKTPAQGQALMAASVPVAIASNQSAVPVSATDLDVRDLTATDVVTVTGGAGQTADVKVTLDSEAITGTVTANIGATNGVALDATLTGGTQQTQIVGSTGVVQSVGTFGVLNVAGVFQVDESGNVLGGTTPMQVALSATAQVRGDFAHDAVDGGNPVKIGGKAHSAEPAAVANADRVNAYFDLTGYQWVKIGNTVTVDGSGVTQPVSAAALPLPTGAATEATLASVKTAVETIDNAISGTEMQVDVVAALPAGTNAIGKLAANSGVDIGDVDVTSAPARVATTDAITAKLATDKIQNGLTAVTPTFAVISGATSGDNTLVAAAGASNKIRVLSYTIVAAGAVDVRFESGAAGTALTGVMSLTTNSGVSCTFSPVGHFETAANTLLNMELSAAVQVSGHLTYVVVQ